MQNSWAKCRRLLAEYFVCASVSVIGARSNGEAQGNADIYCRQPRTARSSSARESRLQPGPSTGVNKPRKYNPGRDAATPENELSDAQIFIEGRIALLSILLLR